MVILFAFTTFCLYYFFFIFVTHYTRVVRLSALRFGGVRTEMLSKEEVLSRWPYINDEDLEGAIWIPDDIIVDTKKITALLAKLSMKQGEIFRL